MDQTTTSVQPTRIGQIHVSVHDLDRATAFYRDALGLQYLFTAPPAMAFFQCGEVRLMLGPLEKPDDPWRASLLYYAVDDIATSHGVLEGHGAEVVRGPQVAHRTPGTELWMAFYRDTEGNLFATMEERAVG